MACGTWFCRCYTDTLIYRSMTTGLSCLVWRSTCNGRKGLPSYLMQQLEEKLPGVKVNIDDLWVIVYIKIIIEKYLRACLLCFSGRVPKLSLIQHTSMLERLRTPPPLLTGEQYGKMETKYPEGGHSQSVLRPQWVSLSSPFIFNNLVEAAAPFKVVSHSRYL